MSVNPEADFDLEKLFLPAWAQETPAANRFANYRGDEEARGERPGREGRGPRRDFGGPPRDSQRGPRRDDRADRGPRGPRPPGGGVGGGGGPRPQGGGAPFGPRTAGPGGPRPDRGERRDFRPAPRPEPEPLPEIVVRITPEEKGADLLARQIKATGRAYPLFDIARLVMQKPERYTVSFAVKKNAEGQILQPLYLCALDDTLWLSENEAVDHILDKHFATFYQADRTQTEPPKGVYTFVAQCGISGVILGPPNHHDYQNKLRELHESRFSRMPFDMFKSRVRIVRDEPVVKKWVEEQSWRTEYICLNVPETPRLPDRVEVEKHFRATHLATIVSQVENRTLGGVAARNLRSPELRRLVNAAVEDQRHFPLQLSTSLSQSFASRGLQFFKVNKTITHVCVARPQYLDLENSVVSDRVKRVVEFLNTHPKCKRRALMEALAPAAAPATPAPAAAPAEGVAPTGGETPAPVAPATPEPTPEQAELSADLHWLIHQGHVVEFSDGHMELARKPLPKAPKPEPKPAAPKAAKPAVEAAAAPAEAPVVTEAAPEPAAAAEVAPTPAPAPPAEAATLPAAEAAAEPAPAEPPSAESEPKPEPPPQP
jgi:hypothetical protein